MSTTNGEPIGVDAASKDPCLFVSCGIDRRGYRFSFRNVETEATRNTSIGIATAKNRHGRVRDNLKVQPYGPVPEVLQVAFHAPPHLLHGVRFTPEALDLGPAGNTGTDLVSNHV